MQRAWQFVATKVYERFHTERVSFHDISTSKPMEAHRTSSLDRGRDTYDKEWTVQKATDFKMEIALPETDPEIIAALWEVVTMAGSERSLRSKTVSQSASTRDVIGGHPILIHGRPLFYTYLLKVHTTLRASK